MKIYFFYGFHSDVMMKVVTSYESLVVFCDICNILERFNQVILDCTYTFLKEDICIS